VSDRVFIFDLETVRNALPWTPKPGREDQLPPAPCWDILCIGGLWIDLDPAGVKVSLRIVPGAGPAEWVATVNRTAERATLVSFNGRGFDAPVIEATALRLNVPIPALMTKRFRGRYDAGHQDVADYLSNHGSVGMVSQDLWCQSIGLPGKGAVCGSDVAGLVAAGRIAEVRDYCLADVLQLGVLTLDTWRMAGALPIALIDDTERAVWKAARENPALEWVWSCPRATRHLEKQAA
jgi:hypothetical protein